MRWLVVASVALVGVVLLVACTGALLPRDHLATRRVRLHRSPAEVWAVIRDFGRAAEWRPDVKSVDLLGEVAGRPRFRENGGNGAILFEVVEEAAAARLVTRIADDSLPFGGTWTYELRAADGGSELTITERGEVKNVVYRALARFVFTHHRTMEQYLRALGRHFGEDLAPAP